MDRAEFLKVATEAQSDDSEVSAMAELNDAQLAFVGGGCGEVVFH